MRMIRSLSKSGLVASMALLALGCVEFDASNSFSNDAQVFSSVEEIMVVDEGTSRFAAAREVFERKCTGCHHAFERYTEEELGAWLTPGDSNGSMLYQYLKGSGLSPASMPPNASLSDADRETIRAWIDGMEASDEGSATVEVDEVPESGVDALAAARFSAALTVIQSKCTSCHSRSFAGYTTEEQFIENGYAVARSTTDSKVYYRMKGGGGGAAGSANMPTNGVSISSAELATGAAWINGISP